MRYSKFFVAMVIISIIGCVVQLFVPVLISVSSGYPMESRLLLIIIMIILSLTAETAITLLRERFAKQYNIKNCNMALRKLCAISYEELCFKGATFYIEKIIQYINHTYKYMTGDAVSIYSAWITMAAILLITAYNNYFIAVVMCCSIPLNYFGYKMLNKKLQGMSEILQEETSKGWQKVLSAIGQVDYLKQSSSYDEIIKKVQPDIQKIYSSMADVNMLAQSVSSLLKNMNEAVRLITMIYVVYETLSNSGDIIFLILYTILLPLFYSNLSVLTNLYLNKRDYKISNDFIVEMERLAEADGNEDIQEIYKIKFDIKEMKIGDTVIAENIYGEYQRGDIVFIKGLSGKGKSTLVKNLVKFRKVDTIYLNDADIQKYRNKSLRQKVEYLSQSVPIFKGTLRDNLFFDIECTQELETYVQNSPVMKTIFAVKTLDSEILENAANLSGGEKQKIALVRALCKNPQVLILDEFTSNVDRETTKKLWDLIYGLRKDKIIFIITHEEIEIRDSEKVLVL